MFKKLKNIISPKKPDYYKWLITSEKFDKNKTLSPFEKADYIHEVSHKLSSFCALSLIKKYPPSKEIFSKEKDTILLAGHFFQCFIYIFMDKKKIEKTENSEEICKNITKIYAKKFLEARNGLMADFKQIGRLRVEIQDDGLMDYAGTSMIDQNSFRKTPVHICVYKILNVFYDPKEEIANHITDLCLFGKDVLYSINS